MIGWREAGALDAQALASLHQECFADEAWSLTQIQGSLTLPTTWSRVAEAQGVIVAFLLAQRVAGETEILTLGVHPSFRRQGLARGLLETLLHDQKEGFVFLDVAADNVAARALYERVGFEVLGLRKGYYKRKNEQIDAVTYRALVNKTTL